MLRKRNIQDSNSSRDRPWGNPGFPHWLGSSGYEGLWIIGCWYVTMCCGTMDFISSTSGGTWWQRHQGPAECCSMFMVHSGCWEAAAQSLPFPSTEVESQALAMRIWAEMMEVLPGQAQQHLLGDAPLFSWVDWLDFYMQCDLRGNMCWQRWSLCQPQSHKDSRRKHLSPLICWVKHRDFWLFIRYNT